MAKKIKTALRATLTTSLLIVLMAGTVLYTDAMIELHRTGQAQTVVGMATIAESVKPKPIAVSTKPIAEDGSERPNAVIVNPGDTLWQIASANYPGKHTGQMVYEIRQANPGIDPGKLKIGQVVKLP